MQASTASALAGATAISTGSLARAPQSGTTNWISDNPSASASAKCPASTNTRALPCYLRLVTVSWAKLCLALPVALPPQGVRHLAGHVVLVMLGEDGIGPENARALEHALGHDPLPFPEKIGQQALIAHLDRGLRIDNLEGDLLVGAALHGAFLHETAEADARAGLHVLCLNVRRRVEEHDGVVHGVEHKAERKREDASCDTDQGQAALLSRHGCASVSFSSWAIVSMVFKPAASCASACLARRAAAIALSRWPRTA